MIFLMSVSIQTLELLPLLVALFTEKEIKTILTHVALLLDLSLATETLVPLPLTHL